MMTYLKNDTFFGIKLKKPMEFKFSPKVQLSTLNKQKTVLVQEYILTAVIVLKELEKIR